MSGVASHNDLISIEEYFRREAKSDVKHDYINGRALAMAGGSPARSLVTANVIRETGNRLKGKPCRVYDSNTLLGIPNSPYTHYPDASVICGELQLDRRDPSGHTVTNPTVVFEVLSPSTEKYDRTDKFDHYRDLPAFREYVLIFQDRREIHTFFRHDDGTWAFNVITDATAVRLQSLQIELSVDELYDGVTFLEPAPDTAARPVT